jgi:hypothetical protein
MSLDIVLLALRIAIIVALYVFLGTALIFLWRDVRAMLLAAEQGRRDSGRLVVVASESEMVMAGQSFPLLPLTTIGRALTNTVALPDGVVSAEHARLALRDKQWWLEDLESKNGTLLNDVPVEEPVVVSTGDIIGVGLVRLRLEIEKR